MIEIDFGLWGQLPRPVVRFCRSAEAAQPHRNTRPQQRIEPPTVYPRAAAFLGGRCHFAAVRAEVFAASRLSWRRSLPLRGWSRRRSFFTPTQKQRKNRFTCDFRLLSQEPAWGFAPPLRGTCAARRIFRRNRRKKGGGSRKSHPHWPWVGPVWLSMGPV